MQKNGEHRQQVADKIIVALDVGSEAEAYALVKLLSPPLSYYKVGMKLFTICGPRIITRLKKLGAKIFLDLKFHDIPHTVASAAGIITSYGVDMFNIHLGGGGEMACAAVEAARETADRKGLPWPLVIGVTVLTSLDAQTLRETGIERSLDRHAVGLAALGLESGLDGVVASSQEAPAIRARCGEDFRIVTPGIRPSWSARDDQERVLTPRQALDAGADYLVIGRPIIKHPSPEKAIEKILAEMYK